MLRRRIFSSAMASVMALSSVAVVANAEETAVANVKTKADLEAYVKSFDTFRDGDIDEYGSISGEKFLDAIEYAENVLEASDATTDDYTVAYAMIEATYNKLKIYSVDELKALIDSCKGIYETNNEYNEEIGDAIYKNDKEQWENFVVAYDEAENLLDSGDARIISDCYEALDAAKSALSREEVVTKAQFRTALKAYETAKQKIYAYDEWRRGTMPGWVDITGGNYWGFWGAKANGVSYGAMMDFISSADRQIYDVYDAFDAVKNASKTSRSDEVLACRTANVAAEMLNAWVADDTQRASKSSVQKLIDQYRGLLVSDYAYEDAYDFVTKAAASGIKVTLTGNKKDAVEYTSVENVFKVDTTDPKINKLECAEWENYGQDDFGLPNYKYSELFGAAKKTGAALYMVNTESNWYIPLDKDTGMWNGEAPSTTKIDGAKRISKGAVVDITQYIDLTGKITAAAPVAVASATTAAAAEEVAVAEAAVAEAEAAVAKIAAPETFTADQKKAVETYAKAANDLIAEIEALIAEIKAALGIADEATAAALAGAASAADLAEYIAELNALIAELDTMCNNSVDGAYKDVYTVLSAGTSDWGTANISAANIWDTFNAFKADAALATAMNDLAATLAEEVEKTQKENLANAADRATSNMNKNLIVDRAAEFINQTWGGDIFATHIKDAGVNVDLEDAMALAETYLSGDKDAIAASTIYDINTTDDITDGTAKGSAQEWAIVYRYLKYALEDKYTIDADASYTMNDVKAMIEKSYEIADLTGDAALFAVRHDTLVDMRKIATEWVAEASKDKTYRDWKEYDGYTATAMYNALESAYKYLERDYNAFKYSFQEIYDQIALVKDMIDCEELEATDTLVKALEDTAYYLSTVKDIEVASGSDELDDAAFTTDRFFVGVNRVWCLGNNNGGNYKIPTTDGTSVSTIEILRSELSADTATHDALKAAYEALLAEVKAQTEVTVLKGDVNGDGVVNAFDASALLKNIVNSVEMDAAVADYDANGVINALDASAILKAIVNA